MAGVGYRLDFGSRFAIVVAVQFGSICSNNWAADKVAAIPQRAELASVEEMTAARTDVWGDAAVRQPNGPSYEFFKDLLPPVRWVDAEFRHYPIVLSAPRSAPKTRLISNGSAVNALANKRPMWSESGVPVAFFVGNEPTPFGSDLARLAEPKLANGYLPIVAFEYYHENGRYLEEAFAPVDHDHAAHGAVMIRFSADPKAPGTPAAVEARISFDEPLRESQGAVLNPKGECLVAFSSAWKWIADRKTLFASLNDLPTAELTIYTKPTRDPAQLTSTSYDKHRQECTETWQQQIDRVRLNTPEKIINDAWRATLVGTYVLAVENRLNYSAGNAYAKQYEAECGDTLRSVMLYGHLENAPAMLKPLLEFDRRATRFHVAGHKLQLLAYVYWLTRDADTVRLYEPLWRQAVELILTSREKATGLLPKDNYAGDVAEQVYSLNSNANCWRGVRDVAAVLDEIGTHDEARRLQQVAAEYRQSILAAVARSERRDTKPPFIPVALLADEPAHDPLTATRQGSYYDLICPYVIGSEIFGQNSERENWLLGYLQQHGGIALGMVRTMPSQGQFQDQPGVVPLYGLRYQLALLRRGERERALVGFYGQLAQGMARGTFIGGEGNRFVHGDAAGRSFYLPPNSASNAAWLITLRYLLIQDWDLDDDARPDTLRYLFGVPRAWLAEGQRIEFANATTMFGVTSLAVTSRLREGFVEARIIPPPRAPKKMLVHAPLPVGWRVETAEINGGAATLVDGATVDITGHAKPVTIRFRIQKAR